MLQRPVFLALTASGFVHKVLTKKMKLCTKECHLVHMKHNPVYAYTCVCVCSSILTHKQDIENT